MSAKKSWDVQPSQPRKSAAPQAVPVTVRHSAPRKPTPRRVPKREQRRTARKAQGIALGIFLAILIIGSVYVAWMPTFRIQTVTANGPHPEAVSETARQTLGGTYLYLAPHDSIFFYSPNRMRKAILDTYPDISAVSIHRTSFHSVEVKATPRATAFIWCGPSIDVPRADGACFNADTSGLVFAEAPADEVHASSTLRIYGPLEGENVEASPVRAHVVNAEAIPRALRLVKAVRELGAPVSSLALRGDEADLWLSGPTRITYLLGKEERALQLATSALPALNLRDHSIQYVDLRFEGKVYVKRHGQ